MSVPSHQLPLHNADAARDADQALREHADQARHWHLADLFADDPERFQRLSLSACGLLADFSKQRLAPATLDDPSITCATSRPCCAG